MRGGGMEAVSDRIKYKGLEVAVFRAVSATLVTFIQILNELKLGEI